MIFQSHWSKPARWGQQHGSLANMLYMYAASAHNLKNKMRVPVGMVTDSDFAAILKDLPMPYDFITTDLDELSGVSTTWWAYPKFLVFKKYAPRMEWLLQIDTDVFFWDNMEIGDHVDLLTQSIEDKHWFGHSYELPVKFFSEKLSLHGAPPAWCPDAKQAFNCGVVGFKNGSLAADYASQAMEICAKMTPYADEFNMRIPRLKRAGSAMVVVEQYFLSCYAKYHNLYTSFMATMMKGDGIARNYDPTDYYHAMADKKNADIRELWKDMVKKEQPHVYEAIKNSAYGGF